MKHLTFRVACLAPLMLFGIGPAIAQQPMPPTGPGGADEANQTRQLENEIEQYPGPNDGVRGDDETRIPEQIRPAPKQRSQATRPPAASPPAPTQSGSAVSSAIDPGEVERVMGSDAGIISLNLLDRARVVRLQTRLSELGHYQGPVDGVVGPKTRAALEAYARAQFTLKQRLIRNDQLTSDLARQLGVDARGPGEGNEPFLKDETDPSLRKDAPLLPPGGAPLPPPGMAPLPTPSSMPSSPPPPRPSSTPPAPPPAP
jgi:hypothetical protein